jgi:glycerol-3-phosphate O-acyltransferase/dihydroxyacetone phosphate acyltransferase
MFKHPFTKFFMEYSGALSVTRNPNYVETSNTHSSDNHDAPSNGDLFKDTVKALSEGEVIGIFPEGTSYTLPAIAQVLPGAARAAIEYARSVRREKLSGMKSDREKQIYLNGVGRNGETTGLRIVPVGIVYENKERYMSRVSRPCVRFLCGTDTYHSSGDLCLGLCGVSDRLYGVE